MKVVDVAGWGCSFKIGWGKYLNYVVKLLIVMVLLLVIDLDLMDYVSGDKVVIFEEKSTAKKRKLVIQDLSVYFTLTTATPLHETKSTLAKAQTITK